MHVRRTGTLYALIVYIWWWLGVRRHAPPVLHPLTPRARADVQWIAIFFAIRRAASEVIQREFRERERPRAVEAFARTAPQPNFRQVISAVAIGNRCERRPSAMRGNGPFSVQLLCRPARALEATRRCQPSAAMRGSARKHRVGDRAHSTPRRWGQTVADAIIAERDTDGAFARPPYTPVPDSNEPRAHRPDPTLESQENYAEHWETVDAFGYENLLATVSRIPAPGATVGYGPGPDEDFEEVKRVGDVDASEEDRSETETNIGIFWAYDGSFQIGARHHAVGPARTHLVAFRLFMLEAVFALPQ